MTTERDSLFGQANAPASSSADVLADFNWGENVMCFECGQHVTYRKCRVISKTSGRWRCPACSVTISQMRRTFESWPTKEFSKLSQEMWHDMFAGQCQVSVCGLAAQSDLLYAAPPHMELNVLGLNIRRADL